MHYRILTEDGVEIDHGQWPAVRSHILARYVETYCQECGYEFVRMRPNSDFSEVRVTVGRKTNKQ